MARNRSTRRSTSPHGKAEPKVGSEPEAAKQVGGKGDFGTPVTDERERAYVSQETKQNDPGAAQKRIKSGDSARVSGAGSNESGPGSGSGGDIDTDIIGVGTGGSGISESGPDRTQGADIITEGGSEPFAAQGPKGHPNPHPRRRQHVKGTTIDRDGGDISTTGGALGSGSVSNPAARGDDSFAADIDQDEAVGGDNSPSDNQ